MSQLQATTTGWLQTISIGYQVLNYRSHENSCFFKKYHENNVLVCFKKKHSTIKQTHFLFLFLNSC